MISWGVSNIPAKLKLSWATGDYDLVSALITGEVKPEGMELMPITLASPERHWRMLRHHEFDVCELSMSSYLMSVCRGEPVIAIPVFPHRRFRHAYIFCNRDARIQTPRDLVGKRIGLRTFQNTAGLWTRGILEDEYGVLVKSVDWFTQDEEPIEFEPPGDLRLQRVSPGRNLDEMLVCGDLDAVIYPETLPSFAGGSPKVKRLFEDPKSEEIRYYQKTGIFPIMHTVVIRREVVDDHPWVPVSLLKAFRQALDVCYQRMKDPRRIALAWVMDLAEEQKRVLGSDPWSPGFRQNKKALETLVRYSYRQGLIDREIPPEDLFATSSLDELPRYV